MALPVGNTGIVAQFDDARDRLVTLEELRLALATTKAQADELRVRVATLLERSVADDAKSEETPQPPRKR